MTRLSDFAYAQARLQARHGMRPDAHTWRRLAGIRDLLHFLQTARTTRLRPWVLHFSAQTGVHAMELSLRQQFRHYIAQVASWQPEPWRNTVAWARHLVDLPALQHLLLGEAPPRWLFEDPVLAPFAVEGLSARSEALENSACAPLVHAWKEGHPLLDGWLQFWQTLWPTTSSALTEPLERLVAQVQDHLRTLGGQPVSVGSHRAREALARELARDFRRYTHQPAAAFVHLAFVALDLEQLRAALVDRMLFPMQAGGSP